MSMIQLARGLWAQFGSTLNPFAISNGMDENLRCIDDHLALYTLLPPQAPGTALPGSPLDGDGQIYTDGSYATFNGGTWKTYAPRPGVRATLADGTDAWDNSGSGWAQFSVAVSGSAIAQTLLAIQPHVDAAAASAALALEREVASEAARDAAIAGAALTWPNTSAGIGQGVQGISGLSGGTGAGANGVYQLAFSATNQTIAPMGNYVVAGGVVIQVNITYPGQYSSGTVPTLSFAASGGSASATAVMGINTAVGKYFGVPSAVVGEAALVYRVTGTTGSPVATYAFTTQSSAMGLLLAARSPGFLVAPATTSPLYKVLQIEIFQSVAGAAITLPSLLCVNECGRDAGGTSGANRFRMRLASFDGTSYVQLIAESPIAGNNYAMAVGTHLAEEWIPLYAISTTIGVPLATVVGRARMGFDASATFGSYGVPIAYALGGIYPDKLQNGARFTNDVREQVRSYPVGMPLDATNAQFKGIKKLRIFGADNSKYYSVRYFFRNDSGTRFNFTISRHTDAAGTGTTDVCAFASTGVNYSGMVEFPLAQLESVLGNGVWSGITGTLVVDFNNTSATFNVSRGFAGENFTSCAVKNDVLFTSAASDAYVDGRISTALTANSALTTGLRIPFADDMASSYLRMIVNSIALYGGNPAHQYAIGNFELWMFSTFSRASITIRDLTASVDVCKYTFSANTAGVGIALATFVGMIPTKVKATDAVVTPKTQIYAVLNVNWANALTGANVSVTSTTTAAAGIHSSCINSDEMIADYCDRDMTHETVRVGSAESAPNTTLRGAVEGIQIAVGTGACNRSHFKNRILFDLVEPVDYSATFLAFPEFTEIRGVGVDVTRIVRDLPDTAHDATLEFHYDGKISDLTIVSDSGDGGAWAGEYCIHSDDFNRISKGGINQNRRIRQKFQRLKLIGGANNNTWLFGCGISSGQTIIMDDVYAEHLRTVTTMPAFGFHNTAPTLSTPALETSYKPATIIMRGCRSPDPVGLYVMSLGTGQGAHDRLVLHGCEFNLIKHEVGGSGEVVTDKAKDRFEWRIGGVHSGPIWQTDNDGMLVLGTTAGQIPSGTAAALIFGTVDELGRGELWIKDTHITITGITQANPGVISCSANHGLWAGRAAPISGVAGMTGINNTYVVNTTPSPTTFTVSLAGTPVDTTGFGAYTSGGIVGIKSLGARLGDCSSVNKTLTIGAQTWTANADYRAQSNATIIAAINAVITTYPVAEVDIQTEIYPDCGYNRRLTNSSGVTIPKGSFVKRVGATISLAGPTDAVYGWVYRTILNGLSGIVVTTKLVHAAYIANAGADGEFGVTAGLLDYAATPKIGRVESSIVQRY